MTDAVELLQGLPAGSTTVLFEGERWSMTVRRSDDRRRHALEARQLAGTEVIGTNLYVTSTGPHLRPCEVPSERVAAFLRGAEEVDYASSSPASSSATATVRSSGTRRSTSST